jgi:hypothetical protein
MLIGTILKDKITDVEYIFYTYNEDNDYAMVILPEDLNKESCGITKILWENLALTGRVVPIGSIPNKYYFLDGGVAQPGRALD